MFKSLKKVALPNLKPLEVLEVKGPDGRISLIWRYEDDRQTVVIRGRRNRKNACNEESAFRREYGYKTALRVEKRFYSKLSKQMEIVL